MTALAASGCLNPEHGPFEGAVCPGCHAALEAAHVALSDRYTRLLAENGELERREREAASDGRVTLNADGFTRTALTTAGVEMINGTDYLQVRPRTRKPVQDVLVLSVGHRTTGNPRSILLERPMMELLHGWFEQWLAEGWPGVPRRCGVRHRPTRLSEWVCDQEPEHRTRHEGPPVGWDAKAGKPGREAWPLSATEYRTRCA